MSQGHQKIAVDHKANVTTTSTGDVSPASQEYSLSMSREVRYSSPFPPAAEIREYDNLVPGSAKQIVALFVEQSQHRMALENKAIDSDIERSKHGLWSATWIASLIVIAGIVAIWQGHPGAGATIIGVDLTSLVGVFIYGTERRRSERIRKSDKTQLPPPQPSPAPPEQEIKVDDTPKPRIDDGAEKGDA